MKPTLLYRIAAVLFVLFAAAHTIGFRRFVPPSTEGLAVRDAMNDVHFVLHGGSYSYGGFYNGFGLQRQRVPVVLRVPRLASRFAC